ncbi:uncharacterized protein G2W53_005558 [Senna tora]|uniref:Uncharacterized protein n=1 Tax=Senna tora TaxID=362788 RepID=A0A835CCY5_9FABA|nr:uncharacterized protein G2W53_005558 [Senna tora]
MLSQQQNPHVLSHSLQVQHQQMGSKEINNNTEGEADIKSFSIREYVVGWREKDIVKSWPFPEKYLQMCVDHGVRNVLPPFGPLADEDDKNVLVSKSEALPDDDQKQQNIIKREDDPTAGLFSKEERSKVMITSQEEGIWCNSRKDKRRRRGKCKKRSMLEILAVAKRSTSEEINRINHFSYIQS